MIVRDTVICDVALPDNWQAKNNKFETEDLDCNMSTFHITSDGQFKKDNFVWLYTGDFEFYAFEKSLIQPYKLVYRKYKYQVFIVEGKLDRIVKNEE